MIRRNTFKLLSAAITFINQNGADNINSNSLNANAVQKPSSQTTIELSMSRNNEIQTDIY